MGVGFVNKDGIDLGDLLVRREFFTTNSGYAWGFGSSGGLGLSDEVSRSEPVAISGSWRKIEGAFTSTISVLGYNSIGLKADGTLWTWGPNAVGNIGDNTVVSRSSPVQIGTDRWIDVASSTNYTVLANYLPSVAAIKNDGTLWTWGSNDYGALGDNSIVNRSSPVQIGAGITWKKVFPKWGGFFAITEKNVLYGWGYGERYNFGDGTNLNRSSPSILLSGTEVEEVITSVNLFYPISFVKVKYPSLNNNSKYKYWGNNGLGGLGTNVTWTAVVTTALNYPYNYDFIGYHTQGINAIDNEGKLWAWGYNNFGAVGDNTTINRSSPVQVMADRRFTKTGRTASGSCYAIESDGSLWAWGSNGSGTVGDITTINRSSPVQVTTNKKWVNVTGAANIFGFVSNDV